MNYEIFLKELKNFITTNLPSDKDIFVMVYDDNGDVATLGFGCKGCAYELLELAHNEGMLVHNRHEILQ